MASVIVVGAGFSGIAAAIELLRGGHDVIVLERGLDVGGVWRENDYPGAACDVWAAVVRGAAIATAATEARRRFRRIRCSHKSRRIAAPYRRAVRLSPASRGMGRHSGQARSLMRDA